MGLLNQRSSSWCAGGCLFLGLLGLLLSVGVAEEVAHAVVFVWLVAGAVEARVRHTRGQHPAFSLSLREVGLRHLWC